MKLKMVDGCDGQSLYLEDTRVAGRKPLGGGRVLWEWKLSVDDIDALRGIMFRATRPDDTGACDRCANRVDGVYSEVCGSCRLFYPLQWAKTVDTTP